MGKWPYWKYFSKDFFDHPPSLVIFASFLSDFSSFLSDMSSREGRKAFSRKFMESFPPKKYWILLHIAFQFPIWCRKEDFFLSCQLQIDDKWQLTIFNHYSNYLSRYLCERTNFERIQFLKIWLQHVVGVESNE